MKKHYLKFPSIGFHHSFVDYIKQLMFGALEPLKWGKMCTEPEILENDGMTCMSIQGANSSLSIGTLTSLTSSLSLSFCARRVMIIIYILGELVL